MSASTSRAVSGSMNCLALSASARYALSFSICSNPVWSAASRSARHTRRRKERPAEFLRNAEQLEHLPIVRILDEIDGERNPAQVDGLLQAELEQEVDLVVDDPVRH